MNYIMLVAGRGSRLQPLTNDMPKSLFHLDKDVTIIDRMVQIIRKYDPTGKIILVTGFMHEMIEKTLKNQEIIFIHNPYYSVTNSIASLWFAQEYMTGETVIINGDIVIDDIIAKEILCRKPIESVVLIDTSIKSDGDYNVRLHHDKIVVMSKSLSEYDGEYAGVSILTAKDAHSLRITVNEMVDGGYYDQWYENALVQMIFNKNFTLKYIDLCNYQWTEVDSVNDLLLAKKIHESSHSH